VDPSENDGDADNKHLQEYVKILPSHLHYLQIPVDDGRENNEHQGSFDEQIVDEKLEGLVREIIFLLYNESFVGRDGHFKGLGFKSLN
jgi:hypothetical protein